MNIHQSLIRLGLGLALATTATCAQVIPLVPRDYSDAPRGVASHVVNTTFCIGTLVDSEAGPLTNATATGDDITALPDDDGIIFPPLVRGTWVNIQVFVTGGGGLLDAWIDFNYVGGFQPPEQIAVSRPVAPGPNFIPVFIPTGMQPGNTYARFRLSRTGGLGPTGNAGEGEVQDYLVPLL